MFNKVVLVGNLTRNIELKYLQNGTAVGSSGIAVNRKFTGQNGEKKEETCFIDVTFFGKVAEVANQYLKKGSKILVEGRLKFDQWTDNNGQNRSKHSIVAENMVMLGGNSQGDGSQGYSQNSQNYPQNSNYSQNTPKQSHKFEQNQDDMGRYEEKIKDIDVDADKFEQNDDEIPF